MTSRAAGGRKHLWHDQAPPSKAPKSFTRGFFSRSKSVAPSPQIKNPSPYPSPPSSTTPLPDVFDLGSNHVPSRSPFPITQNNLDVRLLHSEAPHDVHALNVSVSPPTKHLSSATGPDAYPSPDHRHRALPSKQPTSPEPWSDRRQLAMPSIKKAASVGDMLSDFQSHPLAEHFPSPPTHVFLEATYQPPPPTSRATPRPLPNSPVTGQPVMHQPYPPEKLSPEHTSFPYPSTPRPARPLAIYSVPSPALSELNIGSPMPTRSGLNSSLLLQTTGPSVSPVQELPAYDLSHTPTYAPTRPTLQVTTNLNSSSPTEVTYSRFQRPEDNGRSPSGSEHRHPLFLNNQSPSSTPTETRHGRRSRQTVTENEDHIPLSPSSTQDSKVSSSVGGRTTQSAVSSSSSSSRKSSSVSQRSETPASSGFVFPGSRSTARPKVVSSSGSPRIKFSKRPKSRASKGKGKEEFGTSPTVDSPIADSLASPLSGKQSTSSLRPARAMDRGSTDSRPTSDLRSSPDSSKVAGGSGSSGSTHQTSEGAGRPRTMSTATTATSGTSSSTSSHSSSGFVFPGGRSRAHPNAAPISMPSFKIKKRTSKRSMKSSGSSDSGGRTRFMGIPLKKKKVRAETPPSPLAFTLSSEYFGDDVEGSQIGSITTNGGPAGVDFEAYRDRQMSPEVRRQERVKRIKSRIGGYPLDAYDSILLDNDRHTGDLLYRLNGTGSPSFHEYGNDPPMTVLDLGCGQGHWVVDAAIAWKGHGTKVTGYDMVDISKVLVPWAVKQGVVDNIRFVRGNFLKQQLPFSDNSFDLVRMSSLTLAITADAWIFIFQEVCRVLTIGGRLEFIDDSIIFPYGKPSTSSIAALTTPSTPQLNMFAPRLDIQIPSSAFSTFSIYDSDSLNPGLGFPEDVEEEDLFDLYQVKEEPESDVDDTRTLSGQEPEARTPAFRRDRDPRATPLPRNRSRNTQASSRVRSWNQHAATSRDLEALFEHMLTHKFGIHMRPEEFVLDLMKDVFGHAREVRTMNLSLAPPDITADEDAPRGRRDDSARGHDRYGSFGSSFRHLPSPSPARTISSYRVVGTPLSSSPGLMLSPSTFIPMAQQELEIHASKHLRMLLSCKKFLVEHAMEATEDEEIDEDSVLEALWEYEGFLRARFNHPPDYRDRDKSPSSDAASTHGSIMSISSDGQDAMWEYQSELRQRFAWPLDGADSPTAPRSQITPKSSSATSSNLPATSLSPPPELVTRSGRSVSPSPSIAPPYSRSEMTHVRTFRVYEAVKLDESLLGTAMM